MQRRSKSQAKRRDNPFQEKDMAYMWAPRDEWDTMKKGFNVA